jgi:hypothetical protein
MAKRISACPRGVLCLTPGLGIVVVLGVAIALYFLYQASKPITIVNSIPSSSTQMPNVIVEGGGDDRYTRSPEPLRFWQTPPDLRGALLPPGAIPVNVPTRGLPQAYQQMGIIKSGDKLLPLYGRQTAYRTDRYNYYTRTDTYNPVQLPVKYEKRDCMDSIGCEELLGGEQIKIAGLGETGNVEVYKFDGPTYIPGMV